MNWKKTVKYFYLICILWTIPFLLNFIFEKCNGDKGDPMFFTLLFLLFVVNVVFVKVCAKSKWWKRILVALIVLVISVALCVALVRMDILPFYDPYGIMTFIFGNGIFTVILWKVIFGTRILDWKESTAANSRLA